jgi:hypothetical protein
MKTKKIIIQKPSVLLGHRSEIEAIFKLTKGTKDISQCKNWNEFENLVKRLSKQAKKYNLHFTEKQIKGMVFGQTIFAQCLYAFGIDFGITPLRPASAEEDVFQATDWYVKFADDSIGRLSMKFFSPYLKVQDKDLASFYRNVGIDLAEGKISRPVLMDSCLDYDHRVEKWINKLDGKRIGLQDIQRRIDNAGQPWFKLFADNIIKNYNYYQALAKQAEQEAKQAINALVLDNYDIEDIKIMQDNDFGMFMGSPGWGKTVIQIKGSLEPRFKKGLGPMIYVSRVKGLLEQNMRELVILQDPHPDRILLGGFAGHPMDLKDPIATGSVGSENIQSHLHNVFKKKQSVIIGCVGYGQNPTFDNLLKFCLEHNYPIRIVIDEALEIFPGTISVSNSGDAEHSKKTINLLIKSFKKGLLQMLHLYDAVWTEGVDGMNNSKIGLPSQPLMTRDGILAEQTGRTVPLTVVKQRIKESDIKEYMKLNPEIPLEDVLELNMNRAYWLYVVSNKKEYTNNKLMTFNRGTDSAYSVANDIRNRFNLDVCGTITGNTSGKDRAYFKDSMNDVNLSTFLSNISITAKGYNINACEHIGIAPGRVSSDELMVHIPPRGIRRAKGERGLPIDQCTKREAFLHLGYVENADGTLSDSAKAMEETLKKMSKRNILFKEQNAIYTPPKIKESLLIDLDNENKEKDNRAMFADDELTGKIKIVDSSPQANIDFRQKKFISELKDKTLEELIEITKKKDIND